MEGKREELIRKGPWKAEEDEVLINHVNKYGPRDWSSIRSKGLLQRTGKSCRLRWVNKLRPNLKTGCKFSAEEERVVIELQAQFGNKWARIARYLSGRTDNDVKNFWSSRQKRLARLLHNSAGTPKSQRNKKEVQEVRVCQDVPSMEPQILNTSVEEESSSSAQFCSLPYTGNSETIKMVAVSDLINQKLLHSDTNYVQPDCLPEEKTSSFLLQTPTPFSHNLQPRNNLTFSSEGEDLFPRINEPDLYNLFGPGEAAEIGTGDQLFVGPSFIEPSGSHFLKDFDVDPATPDIFFDDFPAYMFDNTDQPPGSSNL